MKLTKEELKLRELRRDCMDLLSTVWREGEYMPLMVKKRKEIIKHLKRHFSGVVIVQPEGKHHFPLQVIDGLQDGSLTFDKKMAICYRGERFFFPEDIFSVNDFDLVLQGALPMYEFSKGEK